MFVELSLAIATNITNILFSLDFPPSVS